MATCAVVLRRLVEYERFKNILVKVDKILSDYSMRHTETGKTYLLTDITAPEFSLAQLQSAATGRAIMSAPHKRRDQIKKDTDAQLFDAL